MDNWSVVVVIIALVGLGATIVKPIVSLTKSITTLTLAVEGLKEDLKDFRDKNTDSHKRLWEHNQQQDKQLGDHEARLKQGGL